MKHRKYAEALWQCYEKGILEDFDPKDLFLQLINGAVEELIIKRLETECPLYKDYKKSCQVLKDKDNERKLT